MLKGTRYLKQEIKAYNQEDDPKSFTHVAWHPEHALTLLLASASRLFTGCVMTVVNPFH